MKYVDDGIFVAQKDCINNIVFASQMSHKNVLKLLGCRLEAEFPVLVFESVEYETLNNLLFHHSESHVQPLPLKHRLKIAMEIAHVISYLHIGFSRPIVFRDLTSQHIVFCEEYVPKLFDFSLSASIPEGETHIEDVLRGTSAWIAPELLRSRGLFNEKLDVFNFGLLLFQLLTGEKLPNLACRLEIGVDWVDSLQKYIEDNEFERIIDPRIIEDEPLEQQQLRASLELAFKCLSELEEDRPVMVDVAKQLRQMYQSTLTS